MSAKDPLILPSGASHRTAALADRTGGKDRVSEQVYVAKNRRDDQRGKGYSFTSYSFPSVSIEGDRATLEVVRSFTDAKTNEDQDRVNQEAVLEEEGWRIVMRDDQYKVYGVE